MNDKIKKLPCGRPLPSHHKDHSDPEDRSRWLTTKLNTFVAEKQLNQSDSRLRVLELAAAFPSHFTAAELIEKLTKARATIAPATVYRSLQVFVQAGILRETLATDSGEKVYEIESTAHHDHIVCLDCNSIFEFHEPGIESLQERVLSRLEFHDASHRHVLYAHCNYRTLKKD